VTRLALIARADNGGLGNQTWEMANHLKPEKVLVVHSRHITRGHADVSRYVDSEAEVRITPRGPTDAEARWLCYGIDKILTAETFYGTAIPTAARRRGVLTINHCNPEMFRATDTADVNLAPTDWRMDRLPKGTRVVPMPVVMASDEGWDGHRTICHVHSDAMWDRNGTGDLLDALQYLHESTLVTILGGKAGYEEIGKATVIWLGPIQDSYKIAWKQMRGIFVLPRRFGGLCLPIQEAAARSRPIITTNVGPQNKWQGAALVPASVRSIETMPGGRFEVYQCSPRGLAHEIERVLTIHGPLLAKRASEWASERSWEALGPLWTSICRD